ncbi:MAG TPA: hypothetical protein VGM76_05750, partial [Lacipirellulaceae bacterium]
MPSGNTFFRPSFNRVLRLCLVLCQILIASQIVRAADDEIFPPGDHLIVDGIPKIPAELAEHLRHYSEVRGAHLTSWHPVDRRMLITTSFADTRQIHQVDFPGGARTQLTFFKDTADDANYQPTNGDFFVFSKDSGGNEFFQQYAFDVASGAITLLTDGKSRNTGGVWSNAGDQYVYGSTRRTGKDVDLWIMNPADGKSDRILAEMKGGGWGAMSFSPDDRSLLIQELISANESYIWRLD